MPLIAPSTILFRSAGLDVLVLDEDEHPGELIERGVGARRLRPCVHEVRRHRPSGEGARKRAPGSEAISASACPDLSSPKAGSRRLAPGRAPWREGTLVRTGARASKIQARRGDISSQAEARCFVQPAMFGYLRAPERGSGAHRDDRRGHDLRSARALPRRDLPPPATAFGHLTPQRSSSAPRRARVDRLPFLRTTDQRAGQDGQTDRS